MVLDGFVELHICKISRKISDLKHLLLAVFAFPWLYCLLYKLYPKDVEVRRRPQPLPVNETLAGMIRDAIQTILAEIAPAPEAVFGGGSGTTLQTGMAFL
jgi:hypothetical protein